MCVRECVCVCLGERKRETLCVCVCVCTLTHVCMRACVCTPVTSVSEGSLAYRDVDFFACLFLADLVVIQWMQYIV